MWRPDGAGHRFLGAYEGGSFVGKSQVYGGPDLLRPAGTCLKRDGVTTNDSAYNDAYSLLHWPSLGCPSNK